LYWRLRRALRFRCPGHGSRRSLRWLWRWHCHLGRGLRNLLLKRLTRFSLQLRFLPCTMDAPEHQA